jgi:TRAP-type C4-dicarboxylate transport system substrate-binding protein
MREILVRFFGQLQFLCLAVQFVFTHIAPMFQRRTLLKTGAAAALGAPALNGFAQQSITLKFHTFMGPLSNVWLTMHKPWMDKVEKESGGRIKFEAYSAMQLGGTAAQLYDQARDGVVDIVWTLPGYSAGRFPRTEAFELPFMMNNAEATSKALWEYLNRVAVDDYKETHLLAVNVHGPGVLHTKDKLVKTVADLRGMKLRGPSRPVTKMLGYLGAIPVGIPLPGIPDALSKGTIEGCVLPWEVIPSVKVQELTRFHSEFDPSVGAIYTAAFVMAMNRKRYESLPADLRKVIDNNSGLATSCWLGKTQQGNDPLGRKSATDRGNVVTVITPVDAQEFKRKAALVEVEWIEELNKRNIDGKMLRDTARNLIAKHAQRT